MYQNAQDYQIYSVRAAAILTNSYVAGTIIGSPTGVGENIQYQENQLVLLVQFTIGSLTSASIKIETSPDNTTFFQECGGVYAAGVTTVTQNTYLLSASGNYRIPVPIKDRYFKISVIGTGTLTSSSMAIQAMMGVA